MTDRAERRLSPISQYPVHPFLFAAYAVLFLYSQNLAAVLLVDVGDPLAVAIVQAIVFYAGATDPPAQLSPGSRGRLGDPDRLVCASAMPRRGLLTPGCGNAHSSACGCSASPAS